MSAQRLGSRKLRRISRVVGAEVVDGWSLGGYWWDFVTDDHRHGEYNFQTDEWLWEDPKMVRHTTSCKNRWPEPLPRAETTQPDPEATPVRHGHVEEVSAIASAAPTSCGCTDACTCAPTPLSFAQAMRARNW